MKKVFPANSVELTFMGDGKLSVCQIQKEEQKPEQDRCGQCQQREHPIDFCFVFEQFQQDRVHAHTCGGAEGIGDEVGDVSGTQSECELAQFHCGTEEKSVQNRFSADGIQHFQIYAEREKEDDIQQDFTEVEAGADFLVVIKRDEIDASGFYERFDFAEAE